MIAAYAKAHNVEVVREFAEVIAGKTELEGREKLAELLDAVLVRGNTSAGTTSVATFAEDLGLGLDFRVLRRLSWRSEVDALKTGSPDFQRRNLRLSSGFAVRF